MIMDADVLWALVEVAFFGTLWLWALTLQPQSCTPPGDKR